MEYTFEKVSGTSEYQVRLNGEFITYANNRSSADVDAILRLNGWDSRERYFEHVTARVL